MTGDVIGPARVGRQAIRSASEKAAFLVRPGDTMIGKSAAPVNHIRGSFCFGSRIF
jgi:hypothetical protein